MIKQYEGNGFYKVWFDSGTEAVLNESDLSALETKKTEKLEKKLSALESEIAELEENVSDLESEIEKLNYKIFNLEVGN